MPEQADAYIALGSNVGDRRAHLLGALTALAELPDTTLVGASAFHETEPVGPTDQPTYLNAAAHVRTALAPRELLNRLLDIECAHQRDRARETRWGPRTLDLDLLLYADRVIDEPGLAVPHPRLHERAFVLDPLAEIAPDVVAPGLERTIASLRRELHAGSSGAAP